MTIGSIDPPPPPPLEKERKKKLIPKQSYANSFPPGESVVSKPEDEAQASNVEQGGRGREGRLCVRRYGEVQG